MSRASGPQRCPATPVSPTAAARALLRRHGRSAPEVDAESGGPDALATALMDLFRCTKSAEAFETLACLARDQLMRRVRSRMRCLGGRVDADELLQDALINIYRYPDRFDASRPGAFRAWSSTIVDNAVRRRLRRSQTHPDVPLLSAEFLAQEPDQRCMEPVEQAAAAEACQGVAAAFCLLLGIFLRAYESLSERERFVLQMVEVRGMRYQQVAAILSIRTEALKMVVFRARRRIHERLAAALPPCAPVAEARQPSRARVLLAG